MNETEAASAAMNELDGAFIKGALDSIRDSIKIIDHEYNIFYANPAGLALIGKTLDKVTSPRRKCFEVFNKTPGECAYCVVTQVFTTGQPAFSSYTMNVDGETQFKEVSVFPLTDSTGKVEKAIEIIRDVTELRRDMATSAEFSNIISKDPKMQDVFELMSAVAPTSSTVLIYGETGTGKELVARGIHQSSKRAGRKFVAINCASLTDTLLETELFGHEKGSFTGADQRRIGKFELADKGTLFLDEIGNISTAMQVKILRVLQEGEFTRVGGNDVLKTDVRYICATNVDLKEAVRKNEFREDLYYRINVVPIQLPPLRERPGDIPLLADYYLRNFNRAIGKSFAGFSAEAMEKMIGYSWPGNIREFRNLIERAVILSKGQYVDKMDIPAQAGPSKTVSDTATGDMEMKDVVAVAEREYLVGLLKRFNGNITDTARQAGVNARTIHRKVKELDIAREEFR